MLSHNDEGIALLERIIKVCRDRRVRSVKWGGIEIELRDDVYIPRDGEEESDDYDPNEVDQEDYFAASQYRPVSLRAMREQAKDSSE